MTYLSTKSQQKISNHKPGRVVQSEARLTKRARGPRLDTRSSFLLSFPLPLNQEGQITYWRKYVHLLLVNCLGSLSMPRNSVLRLTDRPDMTLAVYRGRKATTHQ